MKVLGSNIISPLGFTISENLHAIMDGRSRLTLYDGRWGLKEPFVASLFDDEQRKELRLEGHSMFESIAIHSIRRALVGSGVDVSCDHTVLILSTTKGNIELLEQRYTEHISASDLSPATAAQHIAEAIGITTKPIVVCNACISGVNAQVLAFQLLKAQVYDNAIVCGADCQGPFIVSGFQSLKTVSKEPCRPFDMERNGLNLGECAATIVLGAKGSNSSNGLNSWKLVSGAVRNDATHITNPSPKGDGCLKAINATIKDEDKSSLSAINVHGTATLFNDQMESKAIECAGLEDVPAFGLKGYLGHTMGANGVVETILTMAALDCGVIPATHGFSELGVSGKIRISNESMQANGYDFLKIVSGFGGNNAAVRYRKNENETLRYENETLRYENENEILITPEMGSLTELYRKYVGDYPKFFKMDGLSRLAFVASELLLNNNETAIDAIILFNHSSSIVCDREHARLILEDNDHLASPSVFVYTLPNIAVGEIAIRRHCQGETAFYILPDEDEVLMEKIVKASLSDKVVHCMLTGWVDYESENNYKAKLKLIRYGRTD